MPVWQYYLWSLLLLTVSGLGWFTNFFGLPGNWIVLGGAALFAYSVTGPEGLGVGLQGLIILAVLAGLGELVEFAAGAMGAAKQGASKRSVALAVVGAMVGGLAGVIVGVPVPLIGSMVAALFGSAIGAFVGAYLGEKWARGPAAPSLAVGQGAFWGRLWGTAGKLIAGAAMLVVLVVDLYFA
ncbi:hypothetical protein Pla123a_16090 [Posidoniimonas polymericola]|uniref:DUF456 domain-containing protein n=1 Tax=Posidoniimonas polymericola TaxID=2528002 RepID=A0A5C5YSP7_9BACT|nr:DUF456 domain-containing protein [Posidoniimonas polymericola]TWT77813.1 hypothetical protein Pla123a_16090 [Posidoniimonas polymericola]